MFTILLSHKDCDQNEVKIRGELHVNRMDKIPLYAAFQDPVTLLKLSIGSYSIALSKASGGSPEDKKARVRARTDLDNAITTVAKTVELAANQLPEAEGLALITNAGFEIRQPSARKNLTFLEKPTNLKAVDVLGFDGTAKVTWKKNLDIVSVCIEFQLNADAPWQNGAYSTGSSTLLTGLPSGTYVNVKIYGIGRKGLKSDYTAYVTVLVS